MLADLPFVLQGLNAPSVEWNADFSLRVYPQLSPATASLVHMLLEPGLLFRRIQAIECPEGLMYQALWDSVEAQFQKYRVILGGLERRAGANDLSLIMCYDMLHEATRGLRALYAILRDVAAGGFVLNKIYPYTRHGDSTISELAGQLYAHAYGPFRMLVREWTTQGTLNDPYQEFYLQINDPESLWAERFKIDYSKLPRDVSQAEAELYYEQGRDIYFLRHLCQDVPLDCTDVLQVLEKQYLLRAHFRAFYDYLLLTRGDFVHSLVAEALRVLDVPRASLQRHELVLLLENAIAQSNAACDEHQVISRLDARTLSLQHDERGWQVFTLDLKLHTPLDVIINKRATRKYLQIFRVLWSLRWVAAKLQRCYLLTNSRSSRFAGTTDAAAMRCWRAQAELCMTMSQFFGEMQSFLYGSVIQQAWHRFNKGLDEARSVDSVTSSHLEYLDEIIQRGLFGGGSVVQRLNELTALAIEFCAIGDETAKGGSYEAAVEQIEAVHARFVETVLQLLALLQSLDEGAGLSRRINFNQQYLAEE